MTATTPPFGIDTYTMRRLVPLGILLACVVPLATAYAGQYGFGLEPCILCLYQRIPFFLNGFLAILLLFGPVRGRWRDALVWLCAGLFFANSALAFYHVGVEHHWWAAATGCGGTLPSQLSLTDLNQALSHKREKPCDEVTFAILGLSIATYNVAYSAALGVATLFGLRLMRETSR